MKRRILVALGLLCLTLAVPAAASAHTGSIWSKGDCEVGTLVYGHLDTNVARSATWKMVVNDVIVDSGYGPGPADLGPYDAGYGSGSAKLVIIFHQEKNTYPTSWDGEQPCSTPTPTPTPTPEVTPTPTPTPTPSPTPSATPSQTPSEPPATSPPSSRPTGPPTDVDPVTTTQQGSPALLLAFGILALIVLVAIGRPVGRKR